MVARRMIGVCGALVAQQPRQSAEAHQPFDRIADERNAHGLGQQIPRQQPRHANADGATFARKAQVAENLDLAAPRLKQSDLPRESGGIGAAPEQDRIGMFDEFDELETGQFVDRHGSARRRNFTNCPWCSGSTRIVRGARARDLCFGADFFLDAPKGIVCVRFFHGKRRSGLADTAGVDEATGALAVFPRRPTASGMMP